MLFINNQLSEHLISFGTIMKTHALQQQTLCSSPVLAHIPQIESAHTSDALNLFLQADWRRMFSDLVQCKHFRVSTHNPLAELHSDVELQQLQIKNGAIWLSGDNILVGGLTHTWAMANIRLGECDDHFETLSINDDQGNHLLAFQLIEDSQWSSFPAMLVYQWERQYGVKISENGRSIRTLQQAGPRHKSWNEHRPPQAGYDYQADITGTLVDSSLIAPFLQTITDQMCPLHIAVSNHGSSQQHDSVFFEYHQSHGQLKLRSEYAEFHLSLDDIQNTHVFVPTSPTDCAQIRLYDDAYHCVCTFALSSKATPSDHELWSMMIAALVD